MKYTILFAITIFSILAYSMVNAQTDGKQSGESGERVIIGTDSDDTINSGKGNYNISAGAGNDTIKAGDGNDLISGGPGDDKIFGGAGDDYIMGDKGNDTVSDGPGSDYINLGPGDDTLVINLKDNTGFMNYADGGEGNDKIVIIVDDPDDISNKDVLEYYQKETLGGKKIVDLGLFNVKAGVSNFEEVIVSTGFNF